jgi:hypothetical protein
VGIMSASEATDDLDERVPSFIWRRMLIGLVVLVVVFLGVGFIQERLSGGSADRLEEIIARLDETDPGWRLEEIEQTQKEIPRASNSAVVVMKAARLLPRNWPPSYFQNRPNLLNREPAAQLSDEAIAVLDRTLAAQAAALAEARKLAAMPHGRYPLEVVRQLARHIEEIRKVETLLRFDAADQAQKGNLAEALRACRALVNVGRSKGDGVQFDGPELRISCAQNACKVIERVLAQGEAADADLVTLGQLLSEEEKHPTLLLAMRGRRALVDDTFTKMENGTIKVRSAISPAGIGIKKRLLGFSDADIRREHAKCLEWTTRMVEIARLPLHEQALAERKRRGELRVLPRDELSVFMMINSDDDKTDENYRERTAQLRSLLVLLAVERYRLKMGQWPPKLDDLKPDLLADGPADPYDGKLLRYVKRADGVTVYSVGPNGRDDGGTLGGVRGGKGGSDVGHRLWDVKARRQPPVAGTR